MFKSRDITLPTKVRLVKAMVFPVVMYGCESWTVKKAEREELMLLNCGVGEDSSYNAGDLGSIPGSGRSPGEGSSYSVQYSCLENSNFLGLQNHCKL